MPISVGAEHQSGVAQCRKADFPQQPCSNLQCTVIHPGIYRVHTGDDLQCATPLHEVLIWASLPELPFVGGRSWDLRNVCKAGAQVNGRGLLVTQPVSPPHRDRGKGSPAVRRPEAAGGHGPCVGAEPTCAHPRRSHQCPGCRERIPGKWRQQPLREAVASSQAEQWPQVLSGHERETGSSGHGHFGAWTPSSKQS